MTDIQKERKQKVLKGVKLSPAQLDTIRGTEFQPYQHEINKGYCYGLSIYNRSDVVLLRNNVGFDWKTCEFHFLMNPLAWMSDKAFELWEELKNEKEKES